VTGRRNDKKWKKGANLNQTELPLQGSPQKKLPMRQDAIEVLNMERVKGEEGRKLISSDLTNGEKRKGKKN